MKKIRDYMLKDQRIFVGLEDSKKTWNVCVRSGNIVVQRTGMKADYEVLRNYFRNNFPDCKITVLYEAGFRGFELHDKLVADGWKCVVTPPHTVTQEKCSKKKNDVLDANRLAKNLENGDYKCCHVPDRQQREDRQLSRAHSRLQKDCTRVCNRIRRMIEFHGLEQYFPSGNWTQATYRQAAGVVEDLSVGESLKLVFETYFVQLDQLRQQQKKVLKELRKLAKSDRYGRSVALLQSAPGIGQLTAIRLTLEWGDISRFKRKEDFSSFLGLTPGEYSTGESEHLGHITKQGNREIRAWLVECAWIAIRYDPVLLEKYNRVALNAQGKGKYKKVAIVAVARKLALRLRCILLSGEPYQVGLEECIKDNVKKFC